MKKFLTSLLITMFFLVACTKQPISDAELTQKELDIINIPVIGKFKAIDLEINLSDNYCDIKAQQIDDNHIIIWCLYYDNSLTNMLYLYDLSSEQILKKIDLNNNRVIRVCNDKIIVGNQQEFYAIDFDLEIVSDKIALPNIMFSGMSKYKYPDKWIQYTISENLQKIVYDNPIIGLNYYNLNDNENHLLFDTQHPPYWYDEYYGDPNLGPDCLNFLPYDEEIYFLCTESVPYEIWVVNLAGEQTWRSEAGSMSDLWRNVWENQNRTTFPCFNENIGSGYGKIYVRQVDLLNKVEGKYKTLPDDLTVSPDTPVPVYNTNYFAYVDVKPNPLPSDDLHYNNPILNENNERSQIVVVDFATMTPQTVLEFPYSCNLNLLIITENGQVMFNWQKNSDSVQFFTGITNIIQ